MVSFSACSPQLMSPRQTTHLKLTNAIAKIAADLNLPKDQDHSAYRFHSDLFLSGLERIILVCGISALYHLGF
jgi:hypothetical protein